MTIAALRRIQDEAELTDDMLFENIEHLLSSCTADVIAARLGMSMEAIEKRCARAGRLKLAAPFNNAVQIQRRSVADLVHRGDHVQVHLG
jgi:hypothetical protein